ncbi:MAG: DNA alkylation repair protein [Candidatus Nomurabacteria bacterium]|jgi:hypothetical protein|nr:DNA alkylation repair protein [Candidatus Nomurabacteria bacterium]
MLEEIEGALKEKMNPEKAEVLLRFFKTGKGEYGEGDVFLGIAVPEVRAVAREYRDLAFDKLEKLVHSKYHEFRLCALCILVMEFETEPESQAQQ